MPSLRELYENGTQEREPYWQRARDISSLTVPSLFPELGANGYTRFMDPFQSVGAGGLASMTSKLVLAQFPPGLRFFRIDVDPKIEEQARRESEETLRQFLAARDERERRIQYHIEQPSFRVRMAEAVRLMLVSGNVLIQRTKTKRWRVWRLPQFVAEVDGEDRLTLAVTRESTDQRFLPKSVREIQEIKRKIDKDEKLDLYTGWMLNDDGEKFSTHQEIEGVRLPETTAEYTREQLPITVARFEPACGEPYGRGMMERVFGDLASLEGMQQSIVEIAAECARFIWGIKPNSVVKPTDLEGAPNGSYRYMNPEDVFPLHADKLTDLQSVMRVAGEIRSDVQGQLGMRVAVQRDKERVTAFEIATMAQDLDATLGGTYSALSEELQLPILRMMEAELVRENEIIAVKGEPIRTRIIAGLEGLGRKIELNQLGGFVAAAAAIPTEEQMGFDLDRRAVLEGFARANGLDPADYLRTEEDVRAMREQAQQAAQAAALGPEMIRQGGGLVKEAMNGR